MITLKLYKFNDSIFKTQKSKTHFQNFIISISKMFVRYICMFM